MTAPMAMGSAVPIGPGAAQPTPRPAIDPSSIALLAKLKAALGMGAAAPGPRALPGQPPVVVPATARDATAVKPADVTPYRFRMAGGKGTSDTTNRRQQHQVYDQYAQQALEQALGTLAAKPPAP